MSSPMTAAEVERFRGVVARRMGLRFEEAKSGFLGEVLGRRLAATRRSSDDYLHFLQDGGSGDELVALADELTVPETYFFRNIEQFHAFTEQVLPDRVRARRADRHLRVLSAGCASGDEAYTIAIILREVLEPGWTSSVRAVDLNPSALQKAQRGRFSSWALRETPEEMKQRWFTRAARDVVLDDSIRQAVQFEQRNLTDDDPDLWADEHYDAVFCRNVIMYFTPERARSLIDRVARSLAPGGYLFLGHAETLRGLSVDFHLCHTHRTFYYRCKSASEMPAKPLPATGGEFGTGTSPSSSGPRTPAYGDSWSEAIPLAAERVRQLVDALPSDPRPAMPPDVLPRPLQELGPALALLRHERFQEALDLVEALPLDVASDPDALLLHAVLLTHVGLLVHAEDRCHRLLQADRGNAGAQYVLALCREGAGDLAGAVDHDRMAAELDPGFAMPRLHLGLLARRAGDLVGMRDELGCAAALLAGEDAERLLLFGGGFNRQALISLCQAELLGSGAAS